jgi:hypothetical protein
LAGSGEENKVCYVGFAHVTGGGRGSVSELYGGTAQ